MILILPLGLARDLRSIILIGLWRPSEPCGDMAGRF